MLLARDDGLTGLANRRTFDAHLANELQRAERESREVSLILIDIDHFKAYNDCYGHQRGDLCLQTVASAVASAAKRPVDLAAGYGGEEFAIILPSTHRDHALAMATALVIRIRELGIPHASNPTAAVVTASIGTATYPTDSRFPSPAALIAQSDEQLYAAKAAGRNRASLSSSA